jgi:predicted PurR-regulated permease PerM
MITPTRVSYAVLVLTIALAGVLHLAPPLLVILFAYFALHQIHLVAKNKWLALALFVVVVLAVAAAAAYFTRAAIRALPDVAETSIPSATAWAQKRQIELPFTDVESLRATIIDLLRQQAQYLRGVAHFARNTVTQIVFCIIGVVAAVSLFLKAAFSHDPYIPSARNNLYAVCTDEVATRFRDFYNSFATVMGAQLTISLINTALTAVFVLIVGLPHAALLIGVTFLCGLIPIVGNLVSNTIIVFVSSTVSLKLALVAVVFLVVIHKLEYFLNSKIIGQRIRNPVWLTLIALVIGERLMGIPGLILAPVVLNYLRVEMLKIEVPEKRPVIPAGPAPVLSEAGKTVPRPIASVK